MSQKAFIFLFIILIIGCIGYLWQNAAPQANIKNQSQEAVANLDNNQPIAEEKNEPAPNEKMCLNMTLTEAKTLAEAGECGEKGSLLNGATCNEGTKTWWLDFNPKEEKSGCNPACVINTETRLVEINWRCTGLSESKKYNMTDIGAHNKADDCWTAIDGKVYDITAYISSHPAGKIILQGCGTDASVLFGAKHSNGARELLGSYYIGDLQ